MWSWIPKVLIDDLAVTPASGGGYIAWNGALQRKKFEEIVAEVKEKFIPTAWAGVKLWIPADSVTYALIPEEFRLLWVDAVEIIWCVILAKSGE